ncbi:rhodanese-like domain-containing protein [Ghiorsea bivora]|uniref:rhodanese-like domain-containing protein n=1 Tax=Ghiorsea bivora TaxID=1485545 RepID=UPI0005709F90|nr:rhodanese-like domain-containing protein [Ghiorsea bivora]
MFIKKQMIAVFAVMLLFSTQATACGMGEVTAEGYENASITHAYQHWSQGKHTQIPFAFVDVRTAKEYKAGHVPGAVNIPVSDITMRMNELSKNKQLYVYCEAGVRAAKASAMLAKAGFHVENLPESMAGWRKAGYPVEK